MSDPRAPKAGWTATGDPVTDINIVREAAGELYRPEGVERWIRAENPMLDGERPYRLVQRGETQRVLDLILALCEGVIF